MAAAEPIREPLRVRMEQFRAWEPEPDMPVGITLAHFFHLWREAEGGRIPNLVSAERLCTFLPPAWEEWGRFLLDEMVMGNEHGPILLDFRGFIHTLLTRWLFPPDHLHPLAVEAEVMGFILPNDPVIPAGQPARSPSPPVSPPRTPPPPPPSPVRAQHEDPYADHYMPLYDPYGIHEQGYIDPLSQFLVPTPATDIPSSPTASYHLTARMSTIAPTEIFTFTYFLDHLGRPYLPSDDWEGSSYEDSSTDTSEETSGNSATDSEGDWV